MLRQCGNAAMAEELFQDVWLSVIRVRTNYTAEARFATYLYRIAHNRLIDYFRRNAHRFVAKPLDDADADLIEAAPAAAHEQPESQILAKERIERFSQLLAALPEAQREAFIMQEEAGLSVAEIAAATGVNTETAKSRLRYAVAKLRRGMLELL
jgi:RNA polymerase sigma-70 factor (ECF subfamily)